MPGDFNQPDPRSDVPGAVIRATGISFSVCADRLCSAIQQAISDKRLQRSLPLHLNVSGPLPPRAGLLPPLERSWEDYQNVVNEYASTSCPEPNLRSWVHLAAPLEPAGHGDLPVPCWPATFSSPTIGPRLRTDRGGIELVSTTGWSQTSFPLIQMGL
jgi:hypothetical protein